jgi:glycosyltransferase involved in cell wall biosynthesis
MRLTFICPRYLTNHAGGAETLCRLIAEKIASRGHSVELLATCAVNPFTWANEVPPRSFESGGITVRLFLANPRKDPKTFQRLEEKIAAAEPLSPEEEAIWADNSLNSDPLYAHIRATEPQTDYFLFMPYLFGLSIHGAKIAPEKSALIPCLHDENFTKLQCIRELFQSVSKLLFNAPPEWELAKKLYQIPDSKSFLVSLGFDAPSSPPDPERFRKKYGITRPFITFCGRRESGKNFEFLLEMTRVFQKTYPKKIQFVTFGSGPVHLEAQDSGNVLDLGFISEEDKMDAYAAALLNCQPSRNESLSIVLMEAWLCGRPVLVNRRCNVTSYWVDLCQGGFTFSDYFDFEQTLVYALDRPRRLQEMSENGHYFVKHNFDWKTILDRLENALSSQKKLETIV